MPEVNAALAGTVKIGGELAVNRIGMGGNRIDDDESSRKILRHAVDRGVNFIDTADIYTGGASETVIGETLAPYESMTVASKGGYFGAKPEALRTSVDATLQRLKLASIDLYYLHRPDPKVPFLESVGALAEAHAAGKIRHIGLSSVSVDQIESASPLINVAAVQNNYSLAHRENEQVLDYCERESIPFVPFFPLRGSVIATDIAQAHGATPQQIAIAWLLWRSPVIAPIPGTLSPAHLDRNLAAAGIKLAHDEIAQLSTGQRR